MIGFLVSSILTQLRIDQISKKNFVLIDLSNEIAEIKVEF